ncbi:thioredoxin family protein [bacterium]|nr:MAG: thioredoxin family protein [bacterium]
MEWIEYEQLFSEILSGEFNEAPYNNVEFVDFVRLNKSRMHRWHKQGVLQLDLIQLIRSINEEQIWILITEPWCMDAANISPFLNKMANVTPLINLQVQLRDSIDSQIENYLTNGTKAIPKLVVQDTLGNDLFQWGPRPQACQEMVNDLKQLEKNPTKIKEQIQKWYNDDQGISMQIELLELITNYNKSLIIQ